MSRDQAEMAEFKNARRRNPSKNAAVETALSGIIRHEQPLFASFAPVDSNGFHRRSALTSGKQWAHLDKNIDLILSRSLLRQAKNYLFAAYIQF
jgi:hypothetical protein